jgi:phosphatidate cytidylyltransferase
MTPLLIKIYLIILAYFALGGTGFYLIGRRKDPSGRRQLWLKYGTYFVIIHVLFFSIALDPRWFRLLGIIIILVGWAELIRVFRRSRRRASPFFVLSLLLYGLLSAGFWQFGRLPGGLILFGFLILSMFDAFSQVSGQLFGRRPLLPRVSPNKTVEGLAGGVVLAAASSFLLNGLHGGGWPRGLGLALGTVAFAFAGDVLSSLYKRHYGVKDFARWLPGHGGFLDRFDSLIAGGAFLALASLLMG